MKTLLIIAIIHTTKQVVKLKPEKIPYLNCKERYEDMIEHHSYTHNLSNCEA